MFWFAALMVRAGAGAARLRLRLVRLPQPRHRRLSVDHHPGDDLCAAARLLPQRHGLRRQQRPDRFQGHPRLQRPGRRRRARRCSPPRAIALALGCVRHLGDRRLQARQGAGRRPRRREPHALPRLPRRERTSCSSSSSRPCMAGIAGALYVPQVGIINPGEFAPANSIEVVIWIAVGGRGTLVGPIIGAHPRQLRQDLVHRRAARILAVRARRPVRRRHAVPAQGHRRHLGPVAPAGTPTRRRAAQLDPRRGRPRSSSDRPIRPDSRPARPNRSRRSRRPCREAEHASSISTASPSPSTASAPSTTCRSCSTRARCAPSSARTAPARRR